MNVITQVNFSRSVDLAYHIGISRSLFFSEHDENCKEMPSKIPVAAANTKTNQLKKANSQKPLKNIELPNVRTVPDLFQNSDDEITRNKEQNSVAVMAESSVTSKSRGRKRECSEELHSQKKQVKTRSKNNAENIKPPVGEADLEPIAKAPMSSSSKYFL